MEGLINGPQYYFRVRIADPLFSAWSMTVPFIVKLASFNSQDLPVQGKVAPVPGAANVSTTPGIQWAAISGAQSYKFQVADNAAFTAPLADTTTAITIYSVTTALKPSETYYWRIQAISGTNVSDWVTSTFQTAAPAAPPTATATCTSGYSAGTPTIIVPTPQ